MRPHGTEGLFFGHGSIVGNVMLCAMFESDQLNASTLASGHFSLER